MKKEIEKALKWRFDRFVESSIDDGLIETTANYVPCGDTDVVEGNYIENEDMDNLKRDFICLLKDEDYQAIREILEEEDIDATAENIQMVLEVANETL